jgi:DNA topoisomerase-3
MQKLLTTGKTDLLDQFVSSRTRRAFKAFLAWDAKEGKVVFEFEQRAPAKKGAVTKTAAKKVPAKKAPAKKTTAKKAAKQ